MPKRMAPIVQENSCLSVDWGASEEVISMLKQKREIRQMMMVVKWLLPILVLLYLIYFELG